MGLFSAYVMLFFLMLVGVMATGVDQVTAWSTVGSALNNLGPRWAKPVATMATYPAWPNGFWYWPC